MSDCPVDPSLAPSLFLASRYRPDIGALPFDMTCKEIRTIEWQLVDGKEIHGSDYDDEGNWINDGTRIEHEICVNGRGSRQPSSNEDDKGLATAYCVATENFRAIAANQVAHIPEDAMKVAEEAGVAPPAKKEAVEVVLTHFDYTSTIWARRMRV